jgi:hypothetical protein
MAELKPQKRGRRIAMSADEIGEFLAGEHTCRVALGGGEMVHDARHAWLRVTPRKINSWDFRKLDG